MPILDTSDFVRKRKLAVIAKANALADPRKFRAPTRDSTYDPYRSISKNISFDDGYLGGKHYVFTSSGGGESVPPDNNQTTRNPDENPDKNPDENPDSVPLYSETLEIPDFFCAEGGSEVVAATYMIINQSTNINFLFMDETETTTPYSFKPGETSYATFDSAGILQCAQ